MDDDLIACSLDSASLSKRQQWIAALNSRSLRSAERSDVSLTLNYERRALDDVRYLVAQEKSCCAFLTFKLTEEGELVRLSVLAPEEMRRAAGPMFDLLAARNASRALKTCDCEGPCGPPAMVRGDGKIPATAATTASLAAVACGVCCTLPFALPAVLAGALGGVFAFFDAAFPWMRGAAIVLVAFGWVSVGWQSFRAGRRPARATMLVMGAASLALSAAIWWPRIENPLLELVR